MGRRAYEGCGIDGVTIDDPGCDDADRVRGVGDLHNTIGDELARRPVPLDGAALRFLRTEMGLDAAACARLLGLGGPDVVEGYEAARRRPVPGMVDRLVRVLWTEAATAPGERPPSVRATLERLAGLDAREPSGISLRRGVDGWWRVASDDAGEGAR